MKKIFLPAFLALIVFGSCSKDDGGCDISIANISGTYKIISIKAKITGLPEIDVFAGFDDCEKDNLQVLEADGDFIYQDAGTACSPAQNYTGTWSLSGATLNLDGEIVTIQNFDCDKITVYADDPGTGARLTSVLDKQ